MKERMKSKVESFARNVQELKGKFVWQNALLKRLAALLYAAQDKAVDYDAIHESYELIKEKTKWFSYFRGNSALCAATLLSLSRDKHKQLENTLAVYGRMKAIKFRSSDYLVIAAYQIAANADERKYSEAIERAKAFYDGMKATHPFITGQSDSIFAAMLGLSDMDLESGLKRMEELYQVLKPEFYSAGGVQLLVQVLAFSGKNIGVETRVLDLCSRFRQKGIRLDKEYTLSSLGILSLLSADADTVVGDVAQTCEILRARKGFGRWSVSRQELLILSCALVAFEYADEMKNDILTASISTVITDIIVAQQTAVAAAAAISAMAASSSSTSS